MKGQGSFPQMAAPRKKKKHAPSPYIPVLVRRYIADAHRRNRKFRISDLELFILTQRDCSYCGRPPASKIRAGGVTYLYNGLDRFLNEKGYEITNVVTACGVCNRMKYTHNYENFIAHALSIGYNFFCRHYGEPTKELPNGKQQQDEGPQERKEPHG